MKTQCASLTVSKDGPTYQAQTTVRLSPMERRGNVHRVSAQAEFARLDVRELNSSHHVTRGSQKLLQGKLSEQDTLLST